MLDLRTRPPRPHKSKYLLEYSAAADSLHTERLALPRLIEAWHEAEKQAAAGELVKLGEALGQQEWIASQRNHVRAEPQTAYPPSNQSVFVQPVIFVLLFRYVFGGATHTGGVAYVDFLMPGIIVQTAIFGALLTGIGLTEDLKAGVVDRFRSLPIARSEVLLGRTAADAMINILTLIVMLLVGVAVGFRPSEPVYDLALAFALVLGFSYVFSWISAFIGLSVRDPETASSAGFVWVFPLTFASSAFVPVSSMPGVVRAFAEINPVTLAVDASRALTIGRGDALAPALGTLAWLAGLLLVFVPLAVRAFRRA
jgi:ABC-2 type transport system permease protein/oleandomycin transport system permease protein